jgi:hypothetical protein
MLSGVGWVVGWRVREGVLSGVVCSGVPLVFLEGAGGLLWATPPPPPSRQCSSVLDACLSVVEFLKRIPVSEAFACVCGGGGQAETCCPRLCGVWVER